MERPLREATSNDYALPSRQIFEAGPLRPTVGDAIRRYWLLVVIAVLACAGVAGYAAYERKPIYQATASLSVGLLDLNTQSVPGFAVGGEVVAAGYSRSVQTDAVVAPVARQLGLTPSQVRSRVSATTVPSSPIFSVTAAGASAGDAIRMANALSRSMVAYSRARSATKVPTARLLVRYRQAVRNADRLRIRVANLRARVSRATSSGSAASASRGGSRAIRAEIARTRAELRTLQLRAAGISQLYRARTVQPPTSAVVQPLVSAKIATNDRRSTIKLYGALGAIVGLLLGTALAVLLMGRRYRRSLGS
jgi:uncharacterized protein involved in exopolysaccharide biosynthesis